MKFRFGLKVFPKNNDVCVPSLSANIASGLMELDEKFERELSNTKSDLKRIVVDELTETINNDKKEVKNKILRVIVMLITYVGEACFFTLS